MKDDVKNAKVLATSLAFTKKAQSLTKAERKSTVAKKVRGSKKGKQFVSNTKSAKYRKKSNEE